MKCFVCGFQSPLHRGNHFNHESQEKIAESIQISVPSSSGKSLQPAPSSTSGLFPSFFSPLFIGEITSTWPLLNRRTQRLLISVPSSSGKSLQPFLSVLRTLTLLLFQSPL